MPMALAGIIIGRDVLLVTGAVVDRVRKVTPCTESSTPFSLLGARIAFRVVQSCLVQNSLRMHVRQG